MAVDTARKRYSMMRFGMAASIPLVFVPDGTVNADDRAMLLGLYNGIALDAPSVVGFSIVVLEYPNRSVVPYGKMIV